MLEEKQVPAETDDTGDTHQPEWPDGVFVKVGLYKDRVHLRLRERIDNLLITPQQAREFALALRQAANIAERMARGRA